MRERASDALQREASMAVEAQPGGWRPRSRSAWRVPVKLPHSSCTALRAAASGGRRRHRAARQVESEVPGLDVLH